MWIKERSSNSIPWLEEFESKGQLVKTYTLLALKMKSFERFIDRE